MSTLIRNDGAVFLIQVYRDQLKQQKSRRMRETLRRLSEQQGRYLQIFADKKGEIEVCLDKNVGFLLGESIVKHFPNQTSFIYLEQMDKAGNSLVVVVKDRKVQLDTLVPTDEIWAELLPLMAGDTGYALFYAGFGERLTIGFPSNGAMAESTAEMLAQATRLPNTLIDALPLDPCLQLMPCEKAIQQSSFSGVSKRIWGATALVVLAVVAIVVSVDLAREDHDQQAAWQLPYAGYYHGVAAEPASQVIAVVVRSLSQVFNLPALQLNRLEYHHKKLELSFISQHAKLQPLLSWAKSHDYNFSLHAGSAKLIQMQHFKPAELENKIYSTTGFYAYLADHLREFHPGSSIRLTTSSRVGKRWQTLGCEWQVSDLTVADLNWLRRLLEHAPVTCESIALSYHDGVMRGTIHLKIWGTQ
jgi:hypothetical protein